MDNLDDDGLFAECIILHRFAVPESFQQSVPFYCRDCVEWGMVCDNEVFDRHKGHDVDIVSPVLLRNGDRLVLRANYFNVDRKEIQDRSLE